MSEFKTRYLSDYKKSDFTIKTVDLTFELHDTNTIVTSVLKVERVNVNATKLALDGEQLKLLSILLDGKTLPNDMYQISDTGLALTVDLATFELTIVTEINPKDNTSLEGLFKSGDAYCTQCEAEGFRRITYYLDRPDVLAEFTTKVIADKSNFPFLLANGNKIDEGDIDDNKHFVQWHDPFLKPCYLFALVAGDFDLLSDEYTTSSGRNVALEIFVDKGNLSKAEHAMSSLKKSMKWDEDTFGLEYDLDIYMIVAVDFFNMGAMENKGLNVFNSKYVLADQASATDTDYFNIEAVIAHEYFHNWTGNRVTCRDWFQLSLKEGLTVFRDQQFSADMHSAAVTRIQNVATLRAHQFPEDAGPMAHPIRPEKVMEMNNFYTLTVYEKGSEVIRMIHTLLGKDKFRAGMDLYFERFDGQAVTCDDFVDAMADGSGIDLTQFKRWYSQVGTPLLTVSETMDDSTNELVLKVEQSLADKQGSNQPSELHIPIAIEVINAKEQTSTKQLLELTKPSQEWRFSMSNGKPIIALLTGFSAPVKTSYQQSNSELGQIAELSTDAFVRWDAGQKRINRLLSEHISGAINEFPEELIKAFQTILTSSGDAALKAEQLSLPSFAEVADNIELAAPQKIVASLQDMKYFIASRLESKLLAVYQDNVQAEYANDGESVGKRALKNVCLSYLSLLPKHQALLTEQFNSADNMTDSLATLACAAKSSPAVFDNLMSDFEQKWQTTTLVMDKWFSIQASYSGDDIFERLEALLSHPLFSLKNPNRARSLIGAFSQNNAKYFHCESGRGYQFLTTQIKIMDEINPQVASRLITPLIQFKAFDEKHQKLMLACLEDLNKQPKLSRDLQEKLSAALKV